MGEALEREFREVVYLFQEHCPSRSIGLFVLELISLPHVGGLLVSFELGAGGATPFKANNYALTCSVTVLQLEKLTRASLVHS